jgi:alkylation response protein AidB-like acyl-CoA dehydrogenase
MSDLLYSEIEDDLRDTLRKLLRDRCEPTAILDRCESDQPYDLELWRMLAADLGVAGLAVPEELGGSGATTREWAVLAEEMGRSVAPVPFLGSVLATATLVECSSSPTAADVLSRLAGGTAIVTVALPMTTEPRAEFTCSVQGKGFALSGTVKAVVDLEVADIAIVPVSDEDGPSLYLLDLTTAGVTRVSTTPLDLTRRFGRLELDGAAAQKITSAEDAPRALHRALTTAAGILASEQVGLAQFCLDSTVDYVLTRYQFGRPVGSFQAIKHRLADVWAGVSTARATARNAADVLPSFDREAQLAVALAQAYCSDLVVLAAEECLQLHGGIGMTWEHPTHLYLGRAKSSQLTFGIPERHRCRIAELTDLRGP